MSDDVLEALRREIAAKHRIIVGADDPILLLLTANDFCIQRAASALEAMQTRALTQQAQQFELHTHKFVAAANQTGARTVELAAAKIHDAVGMASSHAASTIDGAARQLLRPLQLAIVVSVCSSLLSLVAAVLLWLRG